MTKLKEEFNENNNNVKTISIKKDNNEESKISSNDEFTASVEQNKSDNSIKNQEIILMFNRIVTNLINSYERYFQIEYQQDLEKSDSSSKTSLNENDLKNLKEDLLEKCLQTFDDLLLLIINLKRESFYLFINAFQITNITIIKFYEFINRILNNQLKIGSSFVVDLAHHLFIHKTLQLLNVLTANQNKEFEDDESSLICCEQLTHSFNFTSSICLILINFLTPRINNDASKSTEVTSSHSQSLTETDFKLAFEVLNKLTSENPLINVDFYVRKLIQILIEKISDNEYKPAYFQFLSNILRNNPKKIEDIFRSNDKFKQFCRKLMMLIKESHGDSSLILNSIIILIKLDYDKIFNILFPSSSKQSLKIFEPVDIALCILEQNLNEIPVQSTLSKHLSSKLNALNFIHEFIKCQIVRNSLESNQEYASLFLLKLNKILIDSDIVSSLKSFYYDINKTNSNNLCKRLPSSFSIKIIDIFKELTASSQHLAYKLLQIVFNTQGFIENYDNKSTAQHKNQEDLSKLKNIILLKNKNSRNITENYNIFFDYYIKLAKIVVNDKKNLTNISIANQKLKLNNFNMLTIKYYQYLFELIKKNEDKKDFFHLENNIKEFYKVIKEKLNYIFSNYEKDCNVYSDYDFSSNEDLLRHVYFYLIGLADVILKNFPKFIEWSSELIPKLVNFFRESCWFPNQYTKANFNYADDDLKLNASNSIISARLIIRLLFSNESSIDDKNLKSNVIKIFNEEYFICLLSLVSNEIGSNWLNKIAFEILFELNQTSNKCFKEFNFKFPIETFFKYNEQIKLEKATGFNEVKITNSLLSDSLSTIPSIVLPSNKKTNTEIDKLFNFYDYKLEEQNNQIIELMNTLNQYVSSNLLKETEGKHLRAQLKHYVNLENQLKKELLFNEDKKKEFELKLTDLTKSNSILESKYNELNDLKQELEKKINDFQNKQIEQIKEIKNLNEQIDELTKSQQEKDKLNEDIVENLRRTISNEINAKKEFIAKNKDLSYKLQASESKEKELDFKIAQMQKEFDEKSSKLIAENDKLKSIFSFVREQKID